MKRCVFVVAVLLISAARANAQSPAPTVEISSNRCTVILTAPTPTTGTGWRVQFYRDSDVAVGSRDNAAPFSVTRTDIPAGAHSFYYIASTSTQTLPKSAATATVKCELAAAPPGPTPCEVGWIDNWVQVSETVCRPDSTKTVTERRIAVLSPEGCSPVPDPVPSETRDRSTSCPYVPPVSGGVIGPDDLVYRGFIRPQTPQLGGAYALTGVKNANGGVTSFIAMAGELAYEFEVPPNPGLTYAAAPIAKVIKQLGFIYWNNVSGQPCDVQDSSGCWQFGLNSYIYPSGERRTPLTIFGVHGLAWVAGKLLWSFLDIYNSSYGATDHFLGWTDTAGSEKNGWAKPTHRAVNSNAKLLGGNLTINPDGSLGLVGSFGAISRNTDNSHGPCWSETPIPATPGGFNSAALVVNTKLCYSISNKAPRGADYIPDRANPYNPDLDPVGNVGYWTQVDRCDTAVKVETLSGKRGIIFICGLGTGQIWYGHYEAGPGGAVDPCKSSTRGENAQGYRPEWRIYDPNTLIGGHKDAIHTFNPQTLAKVTYDDWWFPCKQFASGAVFDKPASRLYVMAAGYVHYWDIK